MLGRTVQLWRDVVPVVVWAPHLPPCCAALWMMMPWQEERAALDQELERCVIRQRRQQPGVEHVADSGGVWVVTWQLQGAGGGTGGPAL